MGWIWPILGLCLPPLLRFFIITPRIRYSCSLSPTPKCQRHKGQSQAACLRPLHFKFCINFIQVEQCEWNSAHFMKLMGLSSFANEILNDQVKLVFLMETLIKSLILLKLRHRYIKMKRTLLPKLSIEFCLKPLRQHIQQDDSDLRDFYVPLRVLFRVMRRKGLI